MTANGQSDVIGKRLRAFREAQSERLGRRFSQRDFARLIGLKDDAYRAYEYGRAELPERCARMLASEFGANWRDFYEAPQIPEGSAAWVVSSPTELAFVGWIGQAVASPYSAGANVPSDMAREPGAFTGRAADDRCFDLVWPGDLCVFTPSTIVRIGVMALWRSSSGALQLDQVRHNGRGLIAHPLNARYQDGALEGEVLGTLVGLVRDESSRRLTLFDPTGIRP